MSYSVPTTIYQLPKWCNNLTNFLKRLKIKNNFMILLSENCYSKLKSNSTYVNSKTVKAFLQQTHVINVFDYIEIVNIASSGCCLIKSISSSNLKYKYNVSIPKEIIIIVTEEEIECTTQIFTNILEPDKTESPVDCILDDPDIFKNSIVFFTQDAYIRLRKNTSEFSCYSNIERLIWSCDGNYYGGEITLSSINCNNLYIIIQMYFESLKKTFGFNNLPSTIYFIT